MLRFANPEYLLWLVALPLLFVFLLMLSQRNKKKLEQVVDRRLWNALLTELSPAKRTTKQVIFLVATAFLIIASARPQLGTRLEEVKREGIDIFVALDVSLSMKAEDVRPSRLEKAKRDVSALLRKLAGDRVGLIVFAGEAFVQFPLTADYSAADLFISAVDVDAVSTPGTHIAAALEKGLESFPQDLPTQKVIIVVTDGENTEGDVLGAIGKAKDAGVRIYTVGMGTLEGAPIPIYGPGGTRTDYKRDRSGSIVLTRLDESMLQQIALASGGSYRRATSGGNEINEIFKELAALEKTEFGTMQVTGYEEQYQYPLALAILLLLIEALVGERRGKLADSLKKFIRSRAAAMLYVSLLPFTLHAQTVRSHVSDGNEAYHKGNFPEAEVAYRKALEKDASSFQARNNIGNAQYKQNRYDEAVRSFSNAAALPAEATERSKVLHNLGNALLKSGKIPESLEAYKQALRLDPNDSNTRYNLQYARELMKNPQQQKNQQQQQSDRDQQDKQKEQQSQQDQQQNKQDQQQQQQPRSQTEQAKQDQLKQQQAQQQKNQMPKQEAERILEAMKNSEREIQKQLRKREGVRVRTEKDW